MATQTIREILSRDFILAFFAHLVLGSVFHSLLPTLPIYLFRLGANEAEIGVLIGIFAISSLILRPFVGRGLLKIPEKNFMMAGALLFTLTSAAYLLTPPFWPFLVVRAFQGIGFAFFQTATFALMANISPEVHRGQSLSYFTLAGSIAAALGPVGGMFIINHFSFTLFFLVCSGLSLCALFISSTLGMRQIAPLQDSSVEGGFLINKKALPPSIMASFFLFTWGALTAFFPLYAIDRGVANPGFFFTAIALTIILCRSVGGKVLDLYSRERIILPCLTTCIVSMIVLAFSKTLPMFILVAVIWGVGNAFLIPVSLAFALDRVGSASGPAMGTFTAVTDLGVCLGPVIMGIIVHWSSYPTMFLCLALIGVINFNYFYFFVRKKG